MSDLAEFLLARIAEAEAVARQAEGDWRGVGLNGTGTERFAALHNPARVLAECAAKRRIVAEAQDALAVGQQVVLDDAWSGREDAYEEVLQFLALPYISHPDYPGRVAAMSETRPICWRYQEPRGDRLIFSCECAGVGCPHEPVRTSVPPSSRAVTEGGE